ncbi:MAG: RNA polymerase sigma factor [Chloroflexi bacterium]|nr:RNA polymerase sigma factor [Chloroflexota bacterium]MCI0574864.1 RNA polymerase sigma factor [Chloroflexota bacterium]MCI0650106.1 RNA polymerase sigma factor [Chloroflexota bacterium]MCI0731190.1 RNA polymerase sigma factor [Chloroflexota bacterium]
MADPKVPSDEELIRMVQEGRMEAFTNLYQRYLPSVYNRVRYRIPDTDVEDVTQEIFISALKSLQGFRGRAQFSTWLRTLTDRRVADYYRNRNPAETSLEEPSGEFSTGQTAGLNLASKPAGADERVLLREALQALPEHYQEILLLRFAEGMKFKDIARLQGHSLEATKSMFRRAVEALRTEIGEFDA